MSIVPKTVLFAPVVASAVAIGAMVAFAATPIAAHGGKHHVVSVDEIEFKAGPATLPAGARFAVLAGDPTKQGPFVMRLKFPGGYEIPPHLHPEDEHVTVISGGFGMSVGRELDRMAAPLLAPGSFVHIPAGEAHYAWTVEETVVQINAMGPFGIEYVDEKDDPRIN